MSRRAVAREIVDALAVDGIVLQDDTLRTVYDGIKMFLAAGRPIDPSELLRVEDTQVVGAVSALLAEEYSLAGWQRMGVPVRDFSDVAAAYTRDLILRYREVHVRKFIAEAAARLADPELDPAEAERVKEDLKRFTEIRFRLNKELGGRVV